MLFVLILARLKQERWLFFLRFHKICGGLWSTAQSAHSHIQR